MNNITKSLLRNHQARRVLHHATQQQQHALLPTTATTATTTTQSWDENSWTKSTRAERMKQTQNLQLVTISGTKKKTSQQESILCRRIPPVFTSSWSPQRCFFFREESFPFKATWDNSNLLFSSYTTTCSYYHCTRRNFSSFSKTTCLWEKISSNHHGGVTQPSSKDKDSSSSSTDSSSTFSSDSSDSTVTKKERFQNAAQRGKKAVSKGAVSLRGLIQKYGWTFVGTYLGVYFVTLGTLFISVDSGLIDPVTITSIEWPWHHPSGIEDATGDGGGATNTTSSDQKDFDSAVEFVASYMKKFPWTAPYSDFVLRNPHLANLGIAWVATKLTEPIRLPVSIAIVRKMKKDKVKEEDA